MQGPGNRNRTNVAPKTNIYTCSCESSWYSRKRQKRIFATNSWRAKSNRNPENCTNEQNTYSQKSIVNLTKFVWTISIKLIPIIYLQLLFMYNSRFAVIFILYIHMYSYIFFFNIFNSSIYKLIYFYAGYTQIHFYSFYISYLQFLSF